jgi:hypothetical protein
MTLGARAYVSLRSFKQTLTLEYYWADNVISQLSGVPGVRKILFDSRIKYRGIGPRSPLPKESSPVA